jgi:hypothetical protein
MHRTLYLLIVFFALFTPPVFADEVVLKNGDKLTGTIVDSDPKTLTLKSEFVGRVEASGFVGEVKIQGDAIQSITSSQPLHVTSKDGQTLVGNVTTEDSKFDVQRANSGRVVVAKEVVQNVRNKDAQAAYDAEIERLRHPKLTNFWGGTLDTGRLCLGTRQHPDLNLQLSGNAAANDRERQAQPICPFALFNMGLTTTVTKVLSWQTTATNLYLSNPPLGAKTTGLILTTGLHFTFGKPL